MQVPYAYLQIDGRWLDITPHTGDVCAMSGFEIEWGTDTALSQPEPSVLDITITDRTGELAGKSLSLLGARIMIYLSAPPTWTDMAGQVGAYDDTHDTWANLHNRYKPLNVSQPDPLTPCMFVGEVSSGGTVTMDGDKWRIELSATSQLLAWKRLQSQGPTSGDAKYQGLHWIGTPAQRLEEMNRRAGDSGAPTANAGSIDLPPSCAPYDTQDNVSQYDLLHRLFAHSHLMPMWYETPRWTGSTIDPLDLTTPCELTAGIDGGMIASRNDREGISLESGTVSVGDSLTIPEPVTRVETTTRRVTDDDGAIGVDDAEITWTANGLPDNLTMQQNSLTVESDAVSDDQSGGLWAQTTYTPTTEQRHQVAAWIYAQDTRLTPETITVTGSRLDPAVYPDLYRCTPPPPVTFNGSRYHTLAGSDGRPSFSGPWQIIGGIITFDWTNGRPTLQHELHMIPLAINEHHTLTWNDLDGWPAVWDHVGYSWAELGIITKTNKPTTTESEES